MEIWTLSNTTHLGLRCGSSNVTFRKITGVKFLQKATMQSYTYHRLSTRKARRTFYEAICVHQNRYVHLVVPGIYNMPRVPVTALNCIMLSLLSRANADVNCYHITRPFSRPTSSSITSGFDAFPLRL
jgi:hypothetical protein